MKVGEEMKKKNKSTNKSTVSVTRKKGAHVLLLGTAESGKSTLMKQIRIMHNNGHTPEEKIMYRRIILNTILASFQKLVEVAFKKGIIEKTKVDKLSSIKESEKNCLNDDEVNAIASLWQETAVQKVYEANSHLFPQSLIYFMKILDKVAKVEYVPTETDILMVGRKTSGICVMEMKINKMKLKVVDVGGQRKERRKWVHLFEGVTSVVFCVDLSEYDLFLEEDSNVNRMQESLKLFTAILEDEKLKDATIILFLNKKDLFREKIKQKNITTAFPKYSGAQHYEEASAYIQQQFLAKNNDIDRHVFCHTTCAVDIHDMQNEWTSTMRNIFFRTSIVVY